MSKSDFEKWMEYTKGRAGRWTLDPIHDGRNRPDYLFYKPGRNFARGSYIAIDDCTVTGGEFDSAVPSIADAMFTSKWMRKFHNKKDALLFVFGRVGVEVLSDMLRQRHMVSEEQLTAARARGLKREQ